MEQSKIQWTDNTFNPWIGCSKVSPGCKNCYAEADMDNRRKRVVWGVNGTRSVTSYQYWRQPLKWDRDAAAAGVKTKVFCSSLADVFENWEGQVIDSHNNHLRWDGVCDVDGNPVFNVLGNSEYSVPLTLQIIRGHLFKLIEATPNLYWLLLTKRPENIMRMVPDTWQDKFPENVWIGTSVENQEMAEKRIPIISKIPASVRFLSCEPLLEELNVYDLLNVAVYPPIKKGAKGRTLLGARNFKPSVDWVICGGESGHNKRLFKTKWAYGLKEQCEMSNIPFFMKQIDKVQLIPDDLMIRQFPL